jgi:hypothetical protein
MDAKRMTALAVVAVGLLAVKAEAATRAGAAAAPPPSPLLEQAYWSWQGGQRVWIPDAPAYYPPPYYAPPPPAYYAPPYAYGALPYYYGGRGYAHRSWYGGGWHYW